MSNISEIKNAINLIAKNEVYGIKKNKIYIKNKKNHLIIKKNILIALCN